jgi:hypothetical protein
MECVPTKNAHIDIMFKLLLSHGLVNKVPVITPQFVTRDASACLLLKWMHDVSKEKELHLLYALRTA